MDQYSVKSRIESLERTYLRMNGHEHRKYIPEIKRNILVLIRKLKNRIEIDNEDIREKRQKDPAYLKFLEDNQS